MSTAQAQQALTLTSAIGADSRIGQTILAEAYRRMGVQTSFRELPAERALIESNTGRTDGDVMRIEGIEATYPNLVQVPAVVYHIDAVAVTKSLRIKITGWESLKPYRIGTRIGLKFAESSTAGMNVAKTATLVESLRDLDAGRVDVVVVPRLAGLEALKEGNLQGLTILEPPLATIAVYPYLHKKHMALVPQLAEVLRKMDKSGELEALRAKETAKFLASLAQSNP